MTEQFRTIADRTVGNGDPRAIDIRPGDRVTFGESQGPGLPEVARIEKPVADHDHSADPKVWCTLCQHEHIAGIPATTYMCGFGQRDLGAARMHEATTPGHRAYPIAHPTVPLDERPSTPTAAGVLNEIVTRIDLARYVNEDTTSPWGNTDVLELLAHLRQPYTEGGAVAVEHPSLPTREQLAEAQDVVRSLRARAASRDAAQMTYPDPAARGAFARDARLMREAADAFDAVLALVNGAER